MAQRRDVSMEIRSSGKQRLVQLFCHCNTSLPEGMSDLRFAQPGRIVFKRQFGPVVVELEFAQAVGVGEFAEAVDLLGR